MQLNYPSSHQPLDLLAREKHKALSNPYVFGYLGPNALLKENWPQTLLYKKDLR